MQPGLNLYTCVNFNTWEWSTRIYWDLKYSPEINFLNRDNFHSYTGRPGPFLGEYFTFTFSLDNNVRAV